MFKRFYKKLFSCSHKNALINSNEGFCPDCGKYLKKVYYIVRCKDCGIKRIAKRKFDEISPFEKFCTCCGSSDIVIEKYEKLNFTDINYAVEVKEVIENNEVINELEIWIDKDCKKEDTEKKNNPPLISEIKYLKAT